MGLPRHFDLILPLVAILLTSLGVLMIASSTLGESGNLDLALRQGAFAAIGLVFFFLVSRIDTEILRTFAWPFYLLSLLLLIAVFVYGFEVRGSLRWIDLGVFRLQPSELVKLSTIVLLADYMSGHNLRKIRTVAISLVIVAFPTVLIFLQPDLGSALVLVFIWLGMLIAGGIRPRLILAGLVGTAVAIPFVYSLLQGYQRNRILTFLNPGSDPLGTGYNVIQSTIAVGSGGIFGRGFGRGTQSHLNFLPEHHTDFIFATLAEELGLVGAFLLLLLLTLLLWRILRRVVSSGRFGGLTLVGLAILIFFQAAVNIGMNIGLAPVTGITLPFVSYGGSSLITLFAGLGLVEAVFTQRKAVDLEE